MKLKEGATVCCLGDSLTEMGFWIYNINGYLSKKNSRTRFYNCGIGGNTVSNAPYYLEDEVLKYNPDYVTVMFGANDLGYGIYGKEERNASLTAQERDNEILRRRKLYESNVKIIVQMLMQRNVKVILMTPMPFDDYERNVQREILYGASEELDLYGSIVKQIANEYGTGIIDLYKSFRSVENNFEIAGMRLFFDDRVHPNEHGQRIMAAEILKYFGYEIEIPQTPKDLEELPFYNTAENDKRFSVEQKLRSISFFEYGRYNYDLKKQYYLSWDEIAEDLVKKCFENRFEPWENAERYKKRALAFILNKPRKAELRRNLINLTQSM